MRLILKTLAFLVGSFAGGFCAIIAMSKLGRGSVPNVDQAIGIANTYIIFTTFIFVAFTVLLGIAGFVFTQSFTSHKKALESEAIDEIKRRLETDDKLARGFFEDILKTKQIVRLFADLIAEKVTAELKSRRADSMASSEQASREIDEIDAMLHHNVDTLGPGKKYDFARRNGDGRQLRDHNPNGGIRNPQDR